MLRNEFVNLKICMLDCLLCFCACFFGSYGSKRVLLTYDLWELKGFFISVVLCFFAVNLAAVFFYCELGLIYH